MQFCNCTCLTCSMDWSVQWSEYGDWRSDAITFRFSTETAHCYCSTCLPCLWQLNCLGHCRQSCNIMLMIITWSDIIWYIIIVSIAIRCSSKLRGMDTTPQRQTAPAAAQHVWWLSEMPSLRLPTTGQLWGRHFQVNPSSEAPVPQLHWIFWLFFSYFYCSLMWMHWNQCVYYSQIWFYTFGSSWTFLKG